LLFCVRRAQAKAFEAWRKKQRFPFTKIGETTTSRKIQFLDQGQLRHFRGFEHFKD